MSQGIIPVLCLKQTRNTAEHNCYVSYPRNLLTSTSEPTLIFVRGTHAGRREANILPKPGVEVSFDSTISSVESCGKKWIVTKRVGAGACRGTW